MCKIMEEIKAEGYAEAKAEAEAEIAEAREAKAKAEAKEAKAEAKIAKAKESAMKNVIRMLRDGLSVEKASEYSDLSLGEVQELADLLA